MFRKLVSNISFSPALVGQLGFYAKRMKQEELTRRVGLAFTALALVVQSFAVFSPPESANAASSQDIIYGGFKTKEQMLGHWDRNTQNFRDLLKAVGITREELVASSLGKVNSKGDRHSFGRNKTFSYAQGEREYVFPLENGGMGKVYYHPLSLWDTLPYTKQNGSTYDAFQIRSAQAGYFWILLNCGNLTLLYPPRPAPCPPGTTGTYPNCQKPTPKCTITGKTHLDATDPNCKVDIQKCTVAGKTHLPANDPGCKVDVKMCTIPGKTHLPANDPGCVETPAPLPATTCQGLNITPTASGQMFSSTASAINGATISKYTYVVKKDGKVVDTITSNSTNTYNSTMYNQTNPGTYEVSLTVTTSIGAKTDVNCVKSFTIAPPAMCALNPSLKKDDPLCQPCQGDDSVWIKDPKCAAKVIETKTAVNVTQGGNDASKSVAKAGDRIIYTLTAENKGLVSEKVTIEEHLRDVLEYATIIDNGGGVYNAESGVMTWKDIEVEPSKQQSRKFMIQLNPEISAMAQGASNGASYNCVMTNTYGNQVDVRVDCPAPKQIEAVVTELPQTGATENMIFAGSLLAVVAYFYARSRQLKKEVRLIRRDFNMGTI